MLNLRQGSYRVVKFLLNFYVVFFLFIQFLFVFCMAESGIYEGDFEVPYFFSKFVYFLR